MTALPPGIDPRLRYRTYASHLREEFGEPFPRVCVDPGTGCPNRDGTVGSGGCLFCAPRSFSGSTGGGNPVAQVEAGARRLAGRGRRRFLVYFQAGTTTHAPAATLASWYDGVLAVPGVAGLIVGTRPDAVPEPVVELLGVVVRKTAVWVELGLQSAHPASLAAMNRGHGPEAFTDAVCRLRRHPGIRIGAHLIAGLPGEGIEEMNATAEYLAGLRIDGVKIHPFHVVRGTAWGDRHAAEPFPLSTLRGCATAVAGMLERLPAGAVVIRIGASCPPGLLAGPDWINERGALAAAVADDLAARGSWQGRLVDRAAASGGLSPDRRDLVE